MSNIVNKKVQYFPLFGAIVDMSPVVQYIFSHPVLKKLADFVGMQLLISYVAWDSDFGRESSTWSHIEDIDQSLLEMDGSSIYDALAVSEMELASAIRGLEDYIELEILGIMNERINYEFVSKGFKVEKWLFETQAVLSSITCREVPSPDKSFGYEAISSQELGYYRSI